MACAIAQDAGAWTNGELPMTALRNTIGVSDSRRGYALPHHRPARARDRVSSSVHRTAPVAAGGMLAEACEGRIRARFITGGTAAFRTCARSPTLTHRPDGAHPGIRWPARPDLVPPCVSPGCIRPRDPDSLRLARLTPVSTPVEIR